MLYILLIILGVVALLAIGIMAGIGWVVSHILLSFMGLKR